MELIIKTSKTRSLVATTVLSTKIREAVYKIPDHVNYIVTTEFNRLTVETFTAMLILIINYQALINKILQIKQKKLTGN